MLLFFDALVSHAGSTAAAGRALRRLLDVRSPHSNAELSDWAGALEKPERGAGGVGEDPWDDLPVKGMPGYEDEKRRRQREDQEQERLDQLQVSQGGRHCPHCNRVIQQNGGCDQMLCGGHAHTNPLHREGCGREFFWSQARPYQPSVLETRQPPGFSAIATWLMDTDDFISDVADRAAEVALHGLAPADRRYAFANAAACVLLKRGQQKPNLAQALMSKQSLQATLGFEDPSLVPVAGMLCDASAVSASKSLTASLLLGRDGWESTVGTAQKLRNTVVNLLVAVLGGPDNNHLSMLLLKPLHMMNTFPVGFVFGELPGPEGYHFDCGCVLDQQGRASRNRPPLENTHLHFVNFCSWAMLSVGLLIFPQTRAQIQEVLTLRYIREVDPEGLSDVADVACSYAMNFALRCFECVGLCQQLPEDDRALCFFELFHRFRQRAVGLHPALARTFATSDTRHVYEDFWKTLIDQVLEELPQLREEVLRTSQAQEQLLHLQEFRASRSYMHRFFRSFELCSLAVPTAPELSFVSALVTRQEQLAHLPLLGQIVVIQNWISDRLHGIVPESCLDQPLVKLVKQKQKDAEEERHCKRVLCHFESFVKSWKRFYRENEGRLPVECQAGRAALGMETQDSLLEAIDDEDDGTKLPLRFFVNGDEKCQSQVVAEYLCSLWNEMIAAAAAVLRESGGNCELWAGRMERSIPLGLADLLFQDQITEALKSNAFLRRSILRHLRGARGVIAPLVDWTAVQQEILSSAWVHRVQKLDLPPFSRFWPRPETKAVSFDSTAPLDAEVEERVMEFLAQLPLVELQSCREEIARISLHVGDADPRKLVLEMEEISQLRAVLPEQVTALLRGIRVGALNGLREILDQENGEFSHLSKVFMAAPPTEIDLTASLARHFRIRTEATRTVHELAGRDADLRETITNLEESGFCAHLLTSPNTPLLEVYQAVFQCEGVLSQLPCQILGCHLVAVLQSLRVLLRKVRARKCALDRCTCWNPREGIQALSSWAEDESRGPWWEDPQGSEEVTNAAEDVAIVTLAPETMLPWVCWACGTEEIPSHLVHALDPQLRHVLEHCGLKVEEKARPPGDPLEAERKLSKLLDLFEKQVNEFGTVKNSSWQSSLSVKVAHLRTLLDYKECCREKLDEELWRLASSRLGLQGDCALRGAWRRFVGGFAAHASEELEEAVRRVVELPLIVSIIKDAEKYTLEGSKVLLRYKNHYYQLDLIPEPQAEAADAGSIDDPLQGEGVAEPRSLTQRFLRFCASMADRSCRKRLAEKPIQQLEEESSARDRNEERLSRKRVADKPVEVLEQELHSQTRAADKPIGLEKDITGAAGDEATNELTKIEEDGEEDEDSWDIV